MDKIVFAVTRGGSFSGSAVETKTSIPGRSDFFKTSRLADRLTGKSLGSWSSNQVKANQVSQMIDILYIQIASSFGWLILHPKNNPRDTIRRMLRSLED
jgi:hypothetical protein